jgi:tRNA-uridine 2-sulfurtransferase
MRVLVAMSGGVDSSVAAALLHDAGHEVVGVTLKLWGGDSDSGCCSVADVEDARRVAQLLGVDHHVFNMVAAFEKAVVGPYVAGHAAGATPNPCIECNRHIKFDALLARARRLGFDALATGHHARVVNRGGRFELRRGADPAKDQSYVLAMLGQDQLAAVRLPVGELTKAEVRAEAARRGLRTATKPDSQDVCFIGRAEGRAGFLAERLALHPAALVEVDSGRPVGRLEAVELVTVGQRRGIGHGPGGHRRYVVAVDVPRRRVTVGSAEQAAKSSVALDPVSLAFTDGPVPFGAAVLLQTSAHGRPVPGHLRGSPAEPVVQFARPQRPVAPGQTLALYDPEDPDRVLGSGVAQ